MKASESGGQVRREAEERAGANDRKYERFSTDLNATLLRGKTSIEGRVVDVSFTGMFFTTFEPPPLRDLVKIDLELPSGERLRLLGMAVHLVRPGRHRRRPGVGVQLFGNGEGVLAAWDQFVKAVRADHLAAPKKKEPDEPKPEASDEPLDHAPVIDPLDRPTIAEPLDPAPVIEPRDRPTIADPLDPTSVVEPRDRPALELAQAVDPLDHPTIADPLDPASAVDPLAAPTIADPLDHPTIAEPKPLFPEEAEPTPTAVGLPTAMPLPARLPTANLTPIHTTEIALAHDRSDAIEQAVEDAFDALEMEGDPFPDDFGPGDVAPGPEAHGGLGALHDFSRPELRIRLATEDEVGSLRRRQARKEPVLFRTEVHMPIGTDVQLRVMLPDGETAFIVDGRVVDVPTDSLGFMVLLEQEDVEPSEDIYITIDLDNAWLQGPTSPPDE